MEEERELVARARDHEQEAFVSLVEDARDRVWGVCLGITGNRQDAEDAMQDAIATAWQGFDRFRGNSRFSTWLYRIASNICKNKVSRRREYPDSEAGADLATNTTDIGDRVADTQAVRWAVSQLSDEFREAVVLREVAGLAYKEIALHQGVNIQTVKTRIHRARKALRDLLGGSDAVQVS
ncbi:RNA polymerase sigma factor [uncultured Corynebacterium sp.]|uniref:RNA polymerase sigma factor n=1 Tax=uncultured Corynebacterium sp. TaxID=159447 RepID=UPI0025FD803D|nr:sigma-70 family RNA polymerase sigma factor [uncultured Corynebacterium sp.]